MVSERFKQTAQDLWQFADLGTPQFASDGSLSLNFDDLDLTLITSEDDESFLVRAIAGPLGSDGQNHADQIEKVLKLSLGLLSTHDVLFTLEGDELVVSGSYHYRRQSVDALAEVISDVVSATQTALRLTQTSGRPGQIAQNRKDLTVEDVMIFQP